MKSSVAPLKMYSKHNVLAHGWPVEQPRACGQQRFMDGNEGCKMVGVQQCSREADRKHMAKSKVMETELMEPV